MTMTPPNEHVGESFAAEVDVTPAPVAPHEKINNSLLQNPYLLGVALVRTSISFLPSLTDRFSLHLLGVFSSVMIKELSPVS